MEFPNGLNDQLWYDFFFWYSDEKLIKYIANNSI